MVPLLSLVDALPRAHIPQAYGPLAFVGGWLLIGLAIFVASGALNAIAPAPVRPAYRRRGEAVVVAGMATVAGVALAVAAFLAALGAFLIISIIPL